MNDDKVKVFKKLTRVDFANEKFQSQLNLRRLPLEDLPITDVLGRVLAKDVISGIDVPYFDRSAVDGYALKAKETFAASRSNPIVFDVQGYIAAGTKSMITLGKQQTVRIATGACIPEGADAVVLIESTQQTGFDKVEVYSALTPGQNIQTKGEDVKKEEKILTRGTVIQPQDIGIMVSLQMINVSVIRKPKVGVLSTGNELVNFARDVELGKIIDSNRPILMAMIKNLGGEPIDLGIAKDELEDIRSRIAIGLENSDVVLVSGGTSVGDVDLVPKAINSLGKPGILVHGISMRPGKPTALAAIGNKPVILLPGFPVAAMISFNVFVQPVLLKLLGSSSEQHVKQTVQAKMLRGQPSSLGSRTYARVIVKSRGREYVAEPLTTHGSGVISSMIRANGLVIIPENKEGLEEGEGVEVVLLRPLGDRNRE